MMAKTRLLHQESRNLLGSQIGWFLHKWTVQMDQTKKQPEDSLLRRCCCHYMTIGHLDSNSCRTECLLAGLLHMGSSQEHTWIYLDIGCPLPHLPESSDETVYPGTL
ncbi:hypothetical protein H1C71_014544, partial [Ictidomys tridecemlineatus]